MCADEPYHCIFVNPFLWAGNLADVELCPCCCAKKQQLFWVFSCSARLASRHAQQHVRCVFTDNRLSILWLRMHMQLCVR